MHLSDVIQLNLASEFWQTMTVYRVALGERLSRVPKAGKVVMGTRVLQSITHTTVQRPQCNVT